jgi:hypothetical protein
MRQVDGDPGFLLDPRCTRLKAAMMGGYRFDKNGGIDKNKHSHVAEALQYLMLHIASVGEAQHMIQRRDVKACCIRRLDVVLETRHDRPTPPSGHCSTPPILPHRPPRWGIFS